MFASCQLLSEKIIEFDDGFNVIIISQQPEVLQLQAEFVVRNNIYFLKHTDTKEHILRGGLCMIQKVGNNSMIFEKSPVILAASSVVGEKEGQGPLGQYFDHVEKDPKFGMETWEQAESTCS